MAVVFDLFVYLIRISCGLPDKLMVNSLFYATKRLVALLPCALLHYRVYAICITYLQFTVCGVFEVYVLHDLIVFLHLICGIPWPNNRITSMTMTEHTNVCYSNAWTIFACQTTGTIWTSHILYLLIKAKIGFMRSQVSVYQWDS